MNESVGDLREDVFAETKNLRLDESEVHELSYELENVNKKSAVHDRKYKITRLRIMSETQHLKAFEGRVDMCSKINEQSAATRKIMQREQKLEQDFAAQRDSALREMAEVRLACEKLGEENDALDAENAEFKHRAAEIEAALAADEAELAATYEASLAIKEEHEAAQARIEEVDLEIRDLEEELAEILNRRITKFQTTESENKDLIQDLLNRYTALQRDLEESEDLDSRKSELARIRSQIKAKQAEILAKKAETDSAAEELRASQEEITWLQADLEDGRRYENEVRQLLERLCLSEQDNDALKGWIDSCTPNFNATKAEVERKFAEKNENKRYMADVRQRTSIFQHQGHEVRTRQEAERNALQREIDKYERSCAATKKQIEECAAFVRSLVNHASNNTCTPSPARAPTPSIHTFKPSVTSTPVSTNRLSKSRALQSSARSAGSGQQPPPTFNATVSRRGDFSISPFDADEVLRRQKKNLPHMRSNLVFFPTAELPPKPPRQFR